MTHDEVPGQPVGKAALLGAAAAGVAIQAGLLAGGVWTFEAWAPVHGMADASLGPLGTALGTLDARLGDGAALVRRLLVHAVTIVLVIQVARAFVRPAAACVLGVVFGVLGVHVAHIAGPYTDAPAVALLVALLATRTLVGAPGRLGAGRALVAASALFAACLLWRPLVWWALPLLAWTAGRGRRAGFIGVLAAAAAGGAAALGTATAALPGSEAWPSLFALVLPVVGDRWGAAAGVGALALTAVVAGLLVLVFRRRGGEALAPRRAVVTLFLVAGLLAALPWPWYGEPLALGARLAPLAFAVLLAAAVGLGTVGTRRRGPSFVLLGSLLALLAAGVTTTRLADWRGPTTLFGGAADEGDATGGYGRVQQAEALLAGGHADVVVRLVGDVLQRGDVEGVRRLQLALLRADAMGDGVPVGLRLDAANAVQDLAHAQPADPRLPRGDARAARAEAQRLRGAALLAIPDRLGALDAFQRAVALDDESARAHLALGTLLAEARGEDERDRALQHLERAAALEPGRLDTFIALSLLHTDRGDLARATAALDAAAVRHGRDPRLLHARAQLELTGRRDVVRAQEILRRLRESATGGPEGEAARQAAARLEAEIHVAIGRRLYDTAEAEPKERQGRLEAALREMDLAVAADPRHWQADVFAGDVHVARQRHAKARERYGIALEKQPEARWIRDQLARTSFLEAGWILSSRRNEVDDRAAEDLVASALRQEAQSIDLGFAPLTLELAWLRPLVKAREEAEAHVAQPAGTLLRASLYLVLGYEPDARRLVDEVLGALGPDAAQAPLRAVCLLLRATLYERSGELEAARRDYALLGELRPADLLPAIRLVEIELRTALARLRTARVYPDDKERIAEAEKVVAEVAGRARAFADKHPGVLAAGLVAVEADMHERRWLDALQRLNTLARAHPDAPAVHRGYSMVYLEHYTQTADATLIAASDRNVREALRLDPRDVRTLLDAAQLAALAKDFAKAVRYAEEARRFELVARGPARRLLVDLHLRIARYALDGGQAQPAAEALGRARALDPSHPGPWRLEAEMLASAVGAQKGQRLEEALARARRARELAPFDTEVHPILARIQRERALLALVRMSAVRVPADPVTDPAFDGLGDDAKARRVKAHAAALEEQARWRQVAIEALEEAIGLAPDTPETYDAQRRLMALQRNDPEARRARMQAGQDAYLAGREHQRAGRLLDALRAYREAVGLVEGYGPAHFGVLQTTYELLRRPRGTGDAVVEREQEDAWLDQAWHSLGVLDRLDPLSQLPERWLYRGLLHRYRYRRDADEGLRHAARTAFRRYLELESARGREEGTEIDMARTFLADMTRRDDG